MGNPWTRHIVWGAGSALSAARTTTYMYHVAAGWEYHYIFGFFLSGAMLYLRTIFPWFILHPVGLILPLTDSSSIHGSTALVAWIIKLLAIRIGGAKLYEKYIPLFLGLTIGFGISWFIRGFLWVVWYVTTLLPPPPLPF